jgi:hypothetical protein
MAHGVKADAKARANQPEMDIILAEIVVGTVPSAVTSAGFLLRHPNGNQDR